MAQLKRKAIPHDVRAMLLHESGYKCANPVCRMVLTLEVHHLEMVAEGGANEPSNLLPLCPNCHSLHHASEIPLRSLKAWKYLLLAMNEAFDRRMIDMLLTLHKTTTLHVSGDGVLQCASAIASGLVGLSDNHKFRGIIYLTPSPK